MSNTSTGLPPLRIIIPVVMLGLGFMVQPLEVTAQDSISELAVIYGGHSGIQAPPGYTKIPVDLNRNAGGDYIYLCYKKGVGAPITGLAVVYGNNPIHQPPANHILIPVDLNRNAGGDYIYLCYTKDPACTTIRELVVIYGGHSGIQPPEGYTKIGVDLNRDAGGDYIYLCYQDG